MGGSSRKRSRSSQGRQKKSSKKKQKQTHDDVDEDFEPSEGEAEGDTFKVETILASKKGRGGVTLYRVRWKGYGPSDDTWEPIENVASTGHADRYIRKLRAKKLRKTMPGVAVIEYEDGERETVDMREEKFREFTESDGESDDNDDQEDDRELYGQNFDLLFEGATIKIMWPYADLGFECKIISWVPMEETKKSKRKNNSSSESAAPKTQSKETGSIIRQSTRRSEYNHQKKSAYEVEEERETVEKEGGKRPTRAKSGNSDNVKRPSKEKRGAHVTSSSMQSAEKPKAKQSTKESRQIDKHKGAKSSDSTNLSKTATSTSSKQAKMKSSGSSSSLNSKASSKEANKSGKQGTNSVIVIKSKQNKQPAPEKTSNRVDTSEEQKHVVEKEHSVAKLKAGNTAETNDKDFNSSSDSSDESLHWSQKPPKIAGHGIPLFDEPEDDFDSSEEDSDDGSEDSEDGSEHEEAPQRERGWVQSRGTRNLSAEESWTMKLIRKQEEMEGID